MSPHADAGALLKLAECPFCKRAMMFRKALHVSDGNVDAIIHAEPTSCGMVEFADGTTDESIIAKWDRQAASQGSAGGEAVAWFAEYDGHLDTTIYRDTMERWKALGRKITPLYAHPAQEASNCGKVREVLGAFYKTVDVMKSARNKPDHLMCVWADDMKAIEDVMFFLKISETAGHHSLAGSRRIQTPLSPLAPQIPPQCHRQAWGVRQSEQPLRSNAG